MQKKLNIIFYVAILMLIATIITTNRVYPTFAELVIREASFYLGISLVIIFVFLSYYFKMKTKNHLIRKHFIEIIWGPILIILFVGSIIFLQNKIQEDNQLIAYSCVYMDHSNNIIYESIMHYTCEKPTVVSYDEEEVVLIFNEKRSGAVLHSLFDGVWIETDEPMDSSIEIKTEVHLTYDQEMRLVFYQADMRVSRIFLYENQYYHTWINERFQIEQVYTETSMISTQIHLKKPDVHRIENEKILILPDFDEENLVEKMKVIYDMQVNLLPNQQIGFTFVKSEIPFGYPEVIQDNVIGTGSYHENGYDLDIRNTKIYEPNEMITHIIRNPNEIKLTREVIPTIKKENHYALMDENYQLTNKNTIHDEMVYNQNFKYYQRDNIDGTIVSSKQLVIYYNIVDEIYGKQIVKARKMINNIDDYRYYYYLDYFRGFDYYKMLDFNYSDSIFLIHHPIIDYMERNQPSAS